MDRLAPGRWRRLTLLAMAGAHLACGSRTELTTQWTDATHAPSSTAGGGANGASTHAGAAAVAGAGGSAAASGAGGAGGNGGQGGAPALLAPSAQRTPPAFCSVDQWCGANANYVAIWGSSAFDIWVVAQDAGDVLGSERTTYPDGRSVLLHWDGTAWHAVQVETGTHRLYSIWGSSANDIWAVGDSATVLHFDGKSWTPARVPVGAPDAFTSVYGTGPDDVWLVGWGGTVRHYDGATWSTIAGIPFDVLRSVWSSGKEVWITGDQTFDHFDGVAWSTFNLPPSEQNSTSVRGDGRGGAWLGGQAGLLTRWDGTQWQPQSFSATPATHTFRGLWGRTDNDVWAVGEQGTVAHWDGAGWSVSPQLTDSNLNAAWGIAGKTWVVGDNGAFIELDQSGWTTSPIATHKLNRLWGTDARDVWAVGREIVHWDGNQWRDVPRPESGEALAIWGSSSTDVWASGVHGMLLHWDGTTWTSVASPTDSDLPGLWGSAAHDVWAVSAAGRYLHFDGQAWTYWAAPSVGPLRSVWGNGASDVIAVGDERRAHFDGSNWSLLPPHAKEKPTYEVAFGDGRRVWIGGHVAWSAYKAGGANPELGRWDGAAMLDDLEPTGTVPTFSLNESSISAGWAANERDLWISLPWLMHWDGSQWSYSSIGSAPRVTALWGTTTDVWALTNAGQIMRGRR